MTESSATPLPDEGPHLIALSPDQCKGSLIWQLHIQRALALDETYTMEAIWEEIDDGTMQGWAVFSEPAGLIAGLATCIIEQPACRVARICYCGGDKLESWQHLLSELETWAIRERCGRIEIHGRPGWARKFRDYRETVRVLTKELA